METPFFLQNHIIWQFSWGVYTKRRYVTSHYQILFVTKDENNYIFNKQEPYEEDVWFFKDYNRGNDPDRIKGHPCQLPIVLLEKMILISSNENDWIGDVFSGSGGTILAARLNNRNVIGFEIDPDYQSVIKQKARFHERIAPKQKRKTLRDYHTE